MDEKTAVRAFNPRGVLQALHALRRREGDPKSEAVLGDLEQFAQTLAELGTGDAANVSQKRVRRITTGPGHAVLKHAAKLLFERPPHHPDLDLASVLDLQANAIRELAESE